MKRAQSHKFTAITAVMSTLLALGACSHLPWQTPTNAESIDQLRQQHRYVSALKALDSKKPRAADYAQLRTEILTELQRYQAELLQRASALAQQQQFAKAEALIEAERPELPASLDLTQFDAQFSAARDRYLKRWLDEVVQLRAPSLAKERNAYQALLKAANTPELQQAAARHQADVDYFAPLIEKAGSQALAQNDHDKAVQYLAIANQLAPSPAAAQQLKIAEQAVAAEKQKQQTARINVREQRYRELQNVLQKSLRDREFFAARDLLAQIRTLNTRSDEVEAMQSELDSAIAAFVTQQIDAGDRQYSEGHIEAALQNWRAANALTPTTELQEKIDKAQKFVDRLEQLRKSKR